ncbi:uncharacterized protein At4g26485-like isoform X2 [Rutidosis leptorrhynchoides]
MMNDAGGGVQFQTRKASSNILSRVHKDYSLNQSILVVGDGDMSFGLCLAKTLGSGKDMTVTSYDSFDQWKKMYPTAKLNMLGLMELGTTVIYQVDVKTMASDTRFSKNQFERIIYNMPHAGFVDGLSESSDQMIKLHQELVKGYFDNASKLLTVKGEVHLRHHTHPPFDRWEVVELAKNAGLKLFKKVPFNPAEYPTYTRKKGAGMNANQSFPINPKNCSLYKFILEEKKQDHQQDKQNQQSI